MYEPTDTAFTPQTEGQPDSVPDETMLPNEGVRDVFARLYADGRAYAAAEAEKQKLRAGIVGVGIRSAAIFGVIALILLFASIVALFVGLTIVLSQIMPPIWATLIVVAAGLILVMLLLLAAKGCITRMKRAITP